MYGAVQWHKLICKSLKMGSSLGQVIVRDHFIADYSSAPVLTYSQMDPQEQILVTF